MEGVGTSSPQQARRTALGHGVSLHLVLFSRKGVWLGTHPPDEQRRDEECITSLVDGIPYA